MRTQQITLTQYSGKTAIFYRLMKDNLYEKNWKKAPCMKHCLSLTFLVSYCLTLMGMMV